MVNEQSNGAAQSSIGSVGEEAAKLVEVLQRRQQTAGARRSGADGDVGGSGDGSVPLGFEALVGLLAGMPPADRAHPGGDATSPSAPPDPSSAGPTSAEHRPESCAICPLCQTITFVRTLRPDLVEPLERYAAEAARVLRLLAEQAAAPHTGDSTATESAATESAPGAARPSASQDGPS